ncbi:DedA family protein [Octadecabacter sp. G9-8]|uniref:DedA family protein n=1 Tax=Octadecabacter dasysiphoniae TaxID=2909341 RepID=A0ABS9CYF4_9RHOB|nr:DedA family protein [Octadecabacter dasysiphoniae]MCF2872273.1 DedA family protein [Octadecabacter dasysiphoniae]
MTDIVLTLVTDYGVMIVFCVTFLSCLALPVPSSLLMITSGGFAATGDLVLTSVLAAAFLGAVLGDNTGYWIARALGDKLGDWLDKHPKRSALKAKGTAFMEKRGGSSVFFSCWLVAPLGPYINYISGITKFTWLRFAMWGVLGEIVWVGLYVGLGHTFADNISGLASVMGNASGFITALVAVIALGWWLMRAAKKSAAQTA